MATSYPMWVTKRTATLDATGFQFVTKAQRTALLTAGAAQDTFSGLSFIDDSPYVPPEPPPGVSARKAARK